MKITKEALSILLRVVVGCMPPIGKEKRRNNEAQLVLCANQNKDVSFKIFKGGLADGTEMYDAIADFAQDMGKQNIDSEVIIKYFGGSKHIEKTARELKENGANINSEFALHNLFSHLLKPVEVVAINEQEKTFSASYYNNGIEVHIENIMMFSIDKTRIKKGQTVLVHFPLFAYECPSQEINDFLLESQIRNPMFLKAIKYFSGEGFDHKKIPMYCKWINESMTRYSL